MPIPSRPTDEHAVSDPPAPTESVASPVQLGADPRDGADTDERTVRPRPATSTLPLVTLVLGIVGVALGVVVIWYPAAIALGLAAVVVGVLALRRSRADVDPRAQSRATIGTMLGAIAILLGVSAAILLPHAVDRVDHFFASMQHDVNQNVDVVSRGLRSDVNSLDRSTARDLHRLERQNRADLEQFEKRSNDSLDQLGGKLASVESKLSDTERADLTRLEQSLRADIRNLDSAMHTSSDALGERVAKLEQEMADLQTRAAPLTRRPAPGAVGATFSGVGRAGPRRRCAGCRAVGRCAARPRGPRR